MICNIDPGLVVRPDHGDCAPPTAADARSTLIAAPDCRRGLSLFRALPIPEAGLRCGLATGVRRHHFSRAGRPRVLKLRAAAAVVRHALRRRATWSRLRVRDGPGACVSPTDSARRTRTSASTPWLPGLQGLTPLVGSYSSDELQVTVSLALEGDRLLMRRGPGRVDALTPVFPGWFLVRSGLAGGASRQLRAGDRLQRGPGGRLGSPVFASTGLSPMWNDIRLRCAASPLFKSWNSGRVTSAPAGQEPRLTATETLCGRSEG